jgi:hypothetical protein
VAADADDRATAFEGTTGWDGWLDNDLVILVTYQDGKAIFKNLFKRRPHWMVIADDWFDRLRGLFSYVLP